MTCNLRGNALGPPSQTAVLCQHRVLMGILGAHSKLWSCPDLSCQERAREGNNV